MVKTKKIQIGLACITAVLATGIIANGAWKQKATVKDSGTQSLVESSTIVPHSTWTANAVSTTKKTEKGMTVHMQWKGKDGSCPHIHYTNVNGTEDTKMTNPGVPMREECEGWYVYEIPNATSAELQISVPSYGYQTTEQVKEGDAWWFASGDWSQEAPANYTVEMQNSGKQENAEPASAESARWKEVVEDAGNVATTSKITVHCFSQQETPKVYYWNALPVDQQIAWPGVEMQAEGNHWYSYTFDETAKINVLFLLDGTQTEDFRANTSGDWYYDGNSWSQKKPENLGGTTATTTAPDETPAVVTPKPTRNPNITVKTNDFREESIYFVMTARFYDGDSSNNIHCDHDADVGNGDSDPAWRGDFKGLIEKLDYIKALGFSAVWITPVVENASGYDFHGYHAVNMRKVDPRLESDGVTYQTLIDEAHKRGIKIIQDIVLNHTSNSGEEGMFPLVDRSYTLNKGAAGNSVTTKVKDSARGELNNYMNIVSNGAYSDYDAALADSKNGAPWQYHARDQYMKSADLVYRKKVDIGWEDFTVTTGQFSGDCMELNTEYPPVYKYLAETYSNYIGQGVDAFRIDTVKHISRLTMNQIFIPAFQEAAKANGNNHFYMFAEVACRTNEFINHGRYQVSPLYYTWKPKETYAWNDSSVDGKDNLALAQQEFEAHAGENGGSYSQYKNAILEGNQYHTPDYTESSGMGVIDYGMHFNFKNAGEAFRIGKEEDKYMNDSTWNVVYVDSHDYGPAVDGRNDKDGNDLWRYEGGTEAWAENMDLMFTFRGIPCLYYGSEIEFKKGLRIDNYSNPLEQTGRAYFGDHIEGSVTVSDFGVYSNASGAIATTLESTLAKHVAKLNRIRRAVPALQKGQYSTEGCDGGIAYKRRYTEGNIDSYALVAISGDTTFTGVLDGTYVDLVTGDTKTVSGGTLQVSGLSKANMRVYVLQNDTAEAYGATGKIGESLTYLK